MLCGLAAALGFTAMGQIVVIVDPTKTSAEVKLSPDEEKILNNDAVPRVKKKLAARVAQLRFQPVFRQRRRVVGLRIDWHAIRFRSIYQEYGRDSFRRRRQFHALGFSVQSQDLPDPRKLHQHALPAPDEPALREQLRGKRRVLQRVGMGCP